MASPAPKRMTLAEFLEWDDGTDRRYELLDGIPVMMAPSLESHGEIALALGAEIRARLQHPCRVISEAGIAISDRTDTYYVAYLAVTCAPREPGRRMVVEPVLVRLIQMCSALVRWQIAGCRVLARVCYGRASATPSSLFGLQRRAGSIGVGNSKLSTCNCTKRRHQGGHPGSAR